MKALHDARDRLHQALATGDPEHAFAPLGEVLAWLYALAGDLKDPLLSGVKYARNEVLHGEGVLVATYEYEYGTELGLWQLGRGRFGTTTGWHWRFASLPDDPDYPSAHRRYQENCAGHEVATVLDAATALVLASP